MENKIDGLDFGSLDLSSIDLDGVVEEQEINDVPVQLSEDTTKTVEQVEFSVEDTEEEALKENDAKKEDAESVEDFYKQLENNKPADKKGKKKEDKKAEKKDKTTTTKVAPKPKKYTGPRIVKVYGDTLFTETDPNVTNEEIRQRLVNDFDYKEFRKDNTIFDLDETTGILDVGKQFKSKG